MLKKKTVSFILVLVMLIMYLPIDIESLTAFAASSDFTIEDGLLKKYNGSGGDVVIPDGVTEIGVSAFDHCASMTSITIPNSVKTIGGDAFDHCTGLTSIIIPDSVTTIGACAFLYCTGLTCITIPNSVTSIGSGAFFSCTKLKYMSINAKNPSIQDNTILDCVTIKAFTYIGSNNDWNNSAWKQIDCLNNDQVDSYLNTNVSNNIFYGFTASGTSQTIAPFVTQIAKNAFSSYGTMTSLVLPSSLMSYDIDVFDACTNLQSFVIDASNTKYKTVDGVLYSKEVKTLLHYPDQKSGTSFNIPSTVTAVRNCA